MLDLLWKSSLLLAAGALAAVLARRTSAATRHLIWTAALFGALALPLASALLPPLRVEALPAAGPVTVATPRSSDTAARDVFAAPARDTFTAREAATRTVPAGAESRPGDATPTTPVREGAGAEATPASAARSASHPLDWALLATIAWAAGALLLLLRIGVGNLHLRRINSEPASQSWRDLLRTFAAPKGVTLLESSEVETPITWGTVKPIIVIPSAGAAWGLAHKRAVLLHELAHVERKDALTQLLARIACALLWPNPLAWMAAAAMRQLRERACDDRVLADGARPTDYATSLLEVALASRPGSGRAALAMARRGQLEGRLLAVLDPKVDRSPAGRGRKLTVAGAAALFVVPLGSLRAERASQAAPVEAAASAPAAETAAALAPLAKPVTKHHRQAVENTKSRRQTVVASADSPPPPPPAPSAPSAPSSPSSPSGSHSQHIENLSGDRTWSSSFSNDGHGMTMVLRGDAKFSDDADDLISISPGGSFDLTVNDGNHHWHAEIFPEGSGLRRTLLVDGTPRPWDAQWFARELEQLDQHNGFAAKIRFPKLYAHGGADAVLAYVGQMDGDYAKGQYLQLLVQRDPLDDATAVKVFSAVRKMSGDYERGQVLKAAAAKAHLDTDAKREAFLSACVAMSGDYERSQVLQTLIAQPGLSRELVRGILASAAKLSGDYEKSQVLTRLLKHDQVDVGEVLKASNLSGDYERSQVLRAVIATQKLDGDAQLAIIAHTRNMGDYEASQVLVALSRATALTPEARREYESAAERLGDYSRKQVLAALSR
ncbi:MAG TPA: M56 family metallopeptidase [Myxococcales bacterium]|jgi:beta-lactamase regulating signal transducer with metallopeptidase domain